jgi:hypothetical protein
VKKYYQIWILSGIAKIILAAVLPLSSDEAYYWVWSQKLDWSYFDHPGMVAWMMWFGQMVTAGLFVRLPFVIMGHLTPLVWKHICKDYLNENQQILLLSIFLFNPLLGFGSLIGTPDVPLLFFWSLAVYIFQSLLRSQKNSDYIWLGVALGIGFCSKYHIVLFVPAIIAYLTFSKKWKLIEIRYVFWTILFGLMFSFPVLYWNYLHEFSSFTFQIEHGMGHKKWQPYWTYSYLGGVLALAFPPFLLALFKSPKQDHNEKFNLFAKVFALTPLVFFLITSVRGHVELNWILTSLPFIYIVAVKSARRFWFLLHNSIWALLVIVLLLNHWTAMFSGVPDRLREQEYYSPLTHIESSEVYFSTYQMASMIWYLTKVPTRKLPEMSRIDYFDQLDSQIPKSDFKLVRETNAMLPEWIQNHGFKTEKTVKINNDFEIVYFKAP